MKCGLIVFSRSKCKRISLIFSFSATWQESEWEVNEFTYFSTNQDTVQIVQVAILPHKYKYYKWSACMSSCHSKEKTSRGAHNVWELMFAFCFGHYSRRFRSSHFHLPSQHTAYALAMHIAHTHTGKSPFIKCSVWCIVYIGIPMQSQHGNRSIFFSGSARATSTFSYLFIFILFFSVNHNLWCNKNHEKEYNEWNERPNEHSAAQAIYDFLWSWIA